MLIRFEIKFSIRIIFLLIFSYIFLNEFHIGIKRSLTTLHTDIHMHGLHHNVITNLVS